MTSQPVSMSTTQAEWWVTHSVLAALIKATDAKIDWADVQMTVANRLAETGNAAAVDHVKQSLKNIKEWSES